MNNIFDFIIGIRNNYTIHRILMGLKLKEFVFNKGITLDIGGEYKSSYEDNWNIDKNLLYHIDINGTPDINVDVNFLPFKNDSISNFGCFNVLELIESPHNAVNDCFRVLKSDGSLVGYVPFLYPIHNQPIDYWRFSRSGLFNMLIKAGFKNIIIEPIGGRFIVLYDVILPKKIFFIRIFLSTISILLNFLYEKFHSSKYNKEMYPSGYFFIAKK